MLLYPQVYMLSTPLVVISEEEKEYPNETFFIVPEGKDVTSWGILYEGSLKSSPNPS